MGYIAVITMISGLLSVLGLNEISTALLGYIAGKKSSSIKSIRSHTIIRPPSLLCLLYGGGREL